MSKGKEHLIALFRVEVSEKSTLFDEALSRAVTDAAARADAAKLAHALRGAARIVGATELASRLADGEAKLRADQPLDDATIALGALCRRVAASESPLGEDARLAATRPPPPAAAPGRPPLARSAPAALADLSLLEIFCMEAEEHTGALSAALLSLEAAPHSEAVLAQLQRSAHSLKGALRIVGLTSLVALVHAFEDCVAAAQSRRLATTTVEIDVLLSAVDFLAQVARVGHRDVLAFVDSHGGQVSDLSASLGRLAGARSAELVDSGAAAPGEVQPARAAPPRVVRVSSESMDRVLGLSGEVLVESTRLHAHVEELAALRAELARVSSAVESLVHAAKAGAPVGAHAAEVQECLDACRGGLAERAGSLEELARRGGGAAERMYREVIRSRMRPFQEGAQGLHRLARDVAKQLGKRVKFELVGGQTEVDRDVLERLEAPLGHLLRNALDHGIEPPAERAERGKAEVATLRVEAGHFGGMVRVEVSDDGRGIDVERVRAKVVARGMAPPEIARALTPEELHEFVFLPGFSTASRVSDVSGRGVGLDVVHQTLHEVGGSVRLVSRPGEGTTFQLLAPITRSVIRGLVVEVDGEPYAFPLARIDRICRVDLSRVRSLEGRQYFQDTDGENVGLVHARQVLGLDVSGTVCDPAPIVIATHGGARFGIAVDQFLSEQDLVVRRLDARLGVVPEIAAASTLEDGQPVLIFDVDGFEKALDALLRGGRPRVLEEAKRSIASRQKRVLVAEDSLTVREAERALLEGKGYRVDVAVDGVDAWNLVRSTAYDLVLSDVDMPRMNGIELLRALRAEPRFERLPVVIVSYKDREEDRLLGLEAGATAYVTKSSFEDDALTRLVADLIGEPSEP